MRKFVITFIAALSMVAIPAHADRGYRHRSYNHHGGGSAWAGLAVVGALAGLAIMAERSAPVYAEPVYAQPVYSEAPTYLAPPAYAVPVTPAAENWYYCQSSALYYPYTKACPEGWQAVQATPQYVIDRRYGATDDRRNGASLKR